MRKKTFLDGKRFHLGGKRKQKGGLLFGPALGLEIGLVKKLLGGRRKRRRRRKRW